MTRTKGPQMAQIFASERSNTSSGTPKKATTASPHSSAEKSLAALQRKADQSSATAYLSHLQGQSIQRMEDEEMLQGKVIQRMEDEEMLQGKTIQKMEEDEMLQGKALQREEKAGAVSDGGLPLQLQEGIQQLSGTDISGVNVHYNSSAPAAVNAHAFAQGNDIHLASGQERHLPHEAWHVVQQRQGRVSPTTSVAGTPVNDDPRLETEADVMGAKASQFVSRDRNL
ncbi:hypothetical protein RD1_4211 [Roseobacter denitrificans OCh 114]|uniref:eCIS core domain-containing protein n=2 Tax=Roseobacter denitrificans TaxID=2434 RepID=Q160E5_ROSDO|nr:hypothetical protein RD1_4211 [Roseobacter denitrificans OCh 114]